MGIADDVERDKRARHSQVAGQMTEAERKAQFEKDIANWRTSPEQARAHQPQCLGSFADEAIPILRAARVEPLPPQVLMCRYPPANSGILGSGARLPEKVRVPVPGWLLTPEIVRPAGFMQRATVRSPDLIFVTTEGLWLSTWKRKKTNELWPLLEDVRYLGDWAQHGRFADRGDDVVIPGDSERPDISLRKVLTGFLTRVTG